MTQKSKTLLRWGKQTWFITILVLLLLGMCTYLLSPNDLLLGCLLLWLPMLVLLCLSPFYISVAPDALIFYRLLSKKIFHLNEYDVYEIDKKYASTSFRTFGNGGFFAIYGWFYSKYLGNYFRHSVSDEDLLLLVRKRDHRRYVVNCPKDLRAYLESTEIKAFDEEEIARIVKYS